MKLHLTKDNTREFTARDTRGRPMATIVCPVGDVWRAFDSAGVEIGNGFTSVYWALKACRDAFNVRARTYCPAKALRAFRALEMASYRHGARVSVANV